MKDLVALFIFVFMGGMLSIAFTSLFHNYTLNNAVQSCEVRWQQECRLMVVPNSISELLE